MQRRDFMKTGGMVALGATLSTTALSASNHKEQKKSVERNRFKVIDFRCRPPLPSFGGLFKMRLAMFENRPNTLANPATFGKAPASIHAFMAGDKNAMELWWKEIDQCGIESVVVAGRYMKGQPSMSMDTDDLLKYEKKYKNRFYGIAPIVIDTPIMSTLLQHHCLAMWQV